MSLEPKSENEAVFVGYWAKMLQRYGGITEEEFDEISKRRRQEKYGKQVNERYDD